jgi:hypothetical protein
LWKLEKLSLRFEFLCRGDRNSVSYGLGEYRDNQFTRKQKTGRRIRIDNASIYFRELLNNRKRMRYFAQENWAVSGTDRAEGVIERKEN